MSAKYKEYKGLNLTQTADEILAWWEQNHIFEKSISEREGQQPYVFFEGPPSANGLPGIHHVMARAIKDIFCRYKTLQGFQVKRKAGWDTHGLPVELGVEKELGITKEDIGTKISVEDYNKACREAVMRYTDVWNDLTRKMGYWVDMENPYITYESKYMESVWWLLGQLFEKNLLYKGYTIQPYSPKAGTGLSSHELNQPGCYRDVKDTSVVAMFKVSDNQKLPFKLSDVGVPPLEGGRGEDSADVHFLAWTTTPWTLPSNTALTVGKDIEYVLVKTFNQYETEENKDKPIYVIVAKKLVEKVFGSKYLEIQNENTIKENGKFHRIALEFDKRIQLTKILHNYEKNLKKEWKLFEEFDISKISNHWDNLDNVNFEDILFYQEILDKIPYNIVASCKGSELVGIRYEQLLPYAQPYENPDQAFRVIPGDFVTTEDGTGIVHTAPTFGADDAKVAKDAGVPPMLVLDENGTPVPLVDLQGRFRPEMGELAGMYVKNEYYDEGQAPEKSVDVLISIMLKEQNKAFKVEKYEHSYPHCWRTDKPILYYPLDSWFIKSTEKKDRMIALNKTINWKPESTGTGRFGNWLENLNDWNLSRSRYWGIPIPIWSTEDGDERICISSVEQLKAECDKAVAAGVMSSNPLADFVPGDMSKENYNKVDLHKNYVDQIILVSPSGKPMKREADLIDVWFDSGAMPYAQWHYPFENKDLIDNNGAYPADFIAEGVDQTRGWFFTLHAISTMVFDSVAYKNVVSNGLVLDKFGQKMSKRLKNAVDPFITINKYGPDATRWYMITNAQPWDNLKFNEDGITEVQRKFFGTLYNTYGFFALYANIDGFKFEEDLVKFENRPEIDRWILSKLNSLIAEVESAYEQLEPTRAGRLIQDFVNDQLSNWYVRLCRRRFWKGDYTEDKISAYQTLYLCLEQVSIMMSPIAPFYAERLFRDLNGASGRLPQESVHLAQFPKVQTAWIDENLEGQMDIAQQVSSLVLSLRKKHKIKVRQPLQKVMIPILDPTFKARITHVMDLILAEVNVKEMELLENTEGILVKRIKPNFKTIGPKYGKQMKAIANLVATWTQQDIAQIEQTQTWSGNIDGADITLTLEDFEIQAEDIPGWLVASEGGITVALDITISDELRKEGLAREVINRIQNIRKDSGFEVTDRIVIRYEATAEIQAAIEANEGYIKNEVLAEEILSGGVGNGVVLDEEGDLMGMRVEVAVKG